MDPFFHSTIVGLAVKSSAVSALPVVAHCPSLELKKKFESAKIVLRNITRKSISSTSFVKSTET